MGRFRSIADQTCQMISLKNEDADSEDVLIDLLDVFGPRSTNSEVLRTEDLYRHPDIKFF